MKYYVEPQTGTGETQSGRGWRHWLASTARPQSWDSRVCGKSHDLATLLEQVLLLMLLLSTCTHSTRQEHPFCFPFILNASFHSHRHASTQSCDLTPQQDSSAHIAQALLTEFSTFFFPEGRVWTRQVFISRPPVLGVRNTEATRTATDLRNTKCPEWLDSFEYTQPVSAFTGMATTWDPGYFFTFTEVFVVAQYIYWPCPSAHFLRERLPVLSRTAGTQCPFLSSRGFSVPANTPPIGLPSSFSLFTQFAFACFCSSECNLLSSKLIFNTCLMRVKSTLLSLRTKGRFIWFHSSGCSLRSHTFGPFLLLDIFFQRCHDLFGFFFSTLVILKLGLLVIINTVPITRNWLKSRSVVSCWTEKAVGLPQGIQRLIFTFGMRHQVGGHARQGAS